MPGFALDATQHVAVHAPASWLESSICSLRGCRHQVAYHPLRSQPISSPHPLISHLINLRLCRPSYHNHIAFSPQDPRLAMMPCYPAWPKAWSTPRAIHEWCHVPAINSESVIGLESPTIPSLGSEAIKIPVLKQLFRLHRYSLSSLVVLNVDYLLGRWRSGLLGMMTQLLHDCRHVDMFTRITGNPNRAVFFLRHPLHHAQPHQPTLSLSPLCDGPCLWDNRKLLRSNQILYRYSSFRLSPRFWPPIFRPTSEWMIFLL